MSSDRISLCLEMGLDMVLRCWIGVYDYGSCLLV